MPETGTCHDHVLPGGLGGPLFSFRETGSERKSRSCGGS